MFAHLTNLRLQSDLTLHNESGTITITGDSHDQEGLHIRCASPDVFRQALTTIKNQGIGPLRAHRFLRKLPATRQNLRLTIADKELFRIHDQTLTIHYARLLPYTGTLLFG